MLSNIAWALLEVAAIVGLLILIGGMVTFAVFGIKTAIEEWQGE